MKEAKIVQEAESFIIALREANLKLTPEAFKGSEMPKVHPTCARCGSEWIEHYYSCTNGDRVYHCWDCGYTWILLLQGKHPREECDQYIQRRREAEK